MANSFSTAFFHHRGSYTTWVDSNTFRHLSYGRMPGKR